MHRLETPRLLEADPARLGRRDEVGRLHEEDLSLVGSFPFEASKLIRQGVGERVAEELGQRHGADRRSVVELYVPGQALGSNDARSLQIHDLVDELRVEPGFGH
ncbi:MAG TPA: hypothetical protein VJQ81_14650, partial [Reyranella sp.]|nr:hypothetical protein [Reyranella sp.]